MSLFFLEILISVKDCTTYLNHSYNARYQTLFAFVTILFKHYIYTINIINTIYNIYTITITYNTINIIYYGSMLLRKLLKDFYIMKESGK